MFDVIEFDMSLEITWLYKLMNPDNEWLEFALAVKIDRLIWTGENYHNKLLETTKNPFWKSVITAYKCWYKSFSDQEKIQTCFLPIWATRL